MTNSEAGTQPGNFQIRIPLLRNLMLGLALLYTCMSFIPIKVFYNNMALISLTVAAILYLFVSNRKLRMDQLTGEAYTFFLVWLIWAMLGLFWANDLASITGVTFNIAIYSLIFVLFSQMLQSSRRQQQMVVFFQIMFLTYVLIFIWEMATQNHLPGSRLYGTKLPIPTGPFFNENNTSALLLVLLPFLTVDTVLTRKRWLKGLLAIAVVIYLAVTIIQGARLVLIILALYLTFYGIFRASWFTRLVASGFLLTGLLVFASLYPQAARMSGLFVKYQYESTLRENSNIQMTSWKVRKNLIEEGLNMAAGSAFLGVGAGNFEDRMSSGRFHNTAWILNAHNFWIETLANYGILIAVGLFYLYIRWMLRLGKLLNRDDPEKRKFYQACFISMLFFIPLTIIPSTIRWFYPVWFYLAAMHAVSSHAAVEPDFTNQSNLREEYEEQNPKSV